MTTLYIVRHGDTDYNASEGEERVRGWADVPLDDDGKTEAHKAGVSLKRSEVAGIVSSDLPRAKQTANIIAEEAGLKPMFSDKLRTWNTGKFTGELCVEVQDKIDAYVSKPDVTIPEGESFNAFKARLFEGLADAVALYPAGLVIVTHHSCVSILEAWCDEGRPGDHAIDVDAYLNNDDDPGSITVFKTTEAELRGNGGVLPVKFTHEEVDYRDAEGRDRCVVCKAYQGRDKCKKVEPPIEPAYWCMVGVSRIDGHRFHRKGAAMEKEHRDATAA